MKGASKGLEGGLKRLQRGLKGACKGLPSALKRASRTLARGLYIRGLGMCKACTEAAHSEAL